MYSPNSTQNEHKSKYAAKNQLETGADFHKDDSFSLEIQAEREYVQRLKMQREKIEALYTKYDSLLEEIQEKNEKIRQQQSIINQVTSKYKQVTLLTPQLQYLKRQNSELYYENQQLKYSLSQVQETYHNVTSEQKGRINFYENQKLKMDEFNESLSSKFHILEQKYEDKNISFEKERKTLNQKVDQLKKQILHLQNKHISQISVLNSQLLRKQQQIDIFSKDNQKLRQLLVVWEQSNINMSKDHEQKLSKVNTQHKRKVKEIKKEIEELTYNNQILTSKITNLKMQNQKMQGENNNFRELINQEKKINQENMYELKVQINQERSIMREKYIQLETKTAKLEKQLSDGLRRQSQLSACIRKMEESEIVKKNIRCVEKREMQRINRLLLLQK